MNFYKRFAALILINAAAVGGGFNSMVSGSIPIEPVTSPEIKLQRNGDAERMSAARFAFKTPKNNTMTATIEIEKSNKRFTKHNHNTNLYTIAKNLIHPWWKDNDLPTSMLMLRAGIKQHEHNFEEALDDLDLALLQDPRNAQAWLNKLTILKILGKYAEAQTTCMRLFQVSDGTTATIAACSISALNGNAENSYRILEKLVRENPDLERPIRSWAISILADIASRLNWKKKADKHFQQGLALNEHDTNLLTEYIDFLLDNQSSERALDLIEKNSEHHLLSPQTLLQKCIALQATSNIQTDVDSQVNLLKQQIDQMELHGASPHWYIEAKLSLHFGDNPEYALEYALENWKQQQEPKDLRLLLQCALATEQMFQVEQAIAWYKSSGLQDHQVQNLLKQIDLLEVKKQKWQSNKTKNG